MRAWLIRTLYFHFETPRKFVSIPNFSPKKPDFSPNPKPQLKIQNP